MGKKGGKKGKAKRAKRASDASVKPFTGPASEAEANWGEKAPLLDGQSAGTREDWEKYFETATSADQRRAMIKKSADACFSKHPFARIYVQPLTKTIDMFVEAGMPVQPWLDAKYPGSRRHLSSDAATGLVAKEQEKVIFTNGNNQAQGLATMRMRARRRYRRLSSGRRGLTAAPSGRDVGLRM